MDIQKLGTINLLLIEDDEDFRYAMASSLIKRNIKVEAVGTAEEGLNKFDSNDYEVIICDIKLPGMDGIEFLSKVNELDEDLPVILLTGFASLDTAREAVSLKAYDYLLKPLEDIEQLLKPIYNAVHSYRLELENKKLLNSLQIKMYELELSEERYRDLYDSASDIIYTVNTNGIFTSVNQKMEEVTKYKKKELIGKSDRMIISSIKDRMYEIKSKEILEGKQMDTVEVIVTAGNNEDRIGELGMRPIMNENVVIGIQCILRDMTDRIKADLEINRLKEHYENIVSNVPDAILTINKSLRIESVNIAYCNMFGKKREEVLRKGVVEIFDQIVNDKVVDLINAPDSYKKIVHFEWNIQDKHGQPFWVEISISRAVILRKDCILMVISDITDLKRAEEAKKEIEVQIVKMQKMEALGQLASGVAHEFNNLLTIILGHAQLSNAEDSVTEIKDSLHVIEGISKRGSDLVKKLMAYAKPKELKFISMDITKTIDEIIKIQEKQLYLESIKVEREYKDHSRVSYDRGQIEQVFINLIINASHAIKPKGKGKISISVKEENKHVEIRFSDTGIGMEEATRIKIFDPFFTTKGGWAKDNLGILGSGLGLSVTQTIIKQHNGTIAVESEYGKGTTFIIKMPTVASGLVREETQKAKVFDLGIEKIKDLRVIVIDDEEKMIDLMKLIFRKACIENYIIENKGERAITSLLRCRPDVVFLDVVMPDMTGYQVFEKIKAVDPQVPVVFMSGKLDLDNNQFVQKGAYAFIQKPFEVHEIFEILHDIAILKRNSVKYTNIEARYFKSSIGN
ncbi:MAG: response regulator [Spirochaetota bacterium]|nr:response regulator [Spirochaetota bacterium]